MKKYFYAIFLLLVMFVWSGKSTAFAASPWVWDFALQEVAPQGVLKQPTAIYIDKSSSRYYVVDSGNNRLVSYDQQGKFINAFTANNSLEKPFDLVREPGVLWVVEKEKNSLTEIDLKEQKITPHKISYKGKEVFPDRIASHTGSLFLLDKASGNILTIDKSMQVTGVFACEGCSGGFVDFKINNNKLWALDQQGESVHRFSLNGKQEGKITLDASRLGFPRSLIVADDGSIYVLDRHRGTIVVFDNKGQYKYDFFEAGEARGKLYYPIEIQFDHWGRLCVVDEGNGRVQIFRKR
jgi:sugar lactone lactonase YvrE